MPAYKIGRVSRANDLDVPSYDAFEQCPVAESGDGYIIGATPFSTRTKRLRGVQFDTVIFDEASQITLPLAVMGMLEGFLKRRQSWLSSGLDVRGRTQLLHKSYRTTRQILDFATLLYRTRLPDDDEAVPPDLLDMPNGAIPILITLSSEQDETTRVINEIRALREAGVLRGHILVIHVSHTETWPLQRRFRRAFGAHNVADPRDEARQDHIRICPLNGATGLESPIVFLMGIKELYEREQSVRLSPEEREELIRDNTRKLYMALTRVGERIVLTYVGKPPIALKTLWTTA